MSDVTHLALRRVHGTHNAFYLLDARGDRVLEALDFPVVAARAVREFPNVPCDGLLVVLDDLSAYARMRMFNPDGSEAEMCGNGMRCVARHLADGGAPDRFVVQSGAGPISCEVLNRDPFEVRLGMGAVTIAGADESLESAGVSYGYRFVSLGNPHAVVTLGSAGEVRAIDLPRLAADFTRDTRFPHGVNVHAIAKTGPQRLLVRHFERGAGETQACGTGAVASAVAAIERGLVTSPVTLDVPGGTLFVTWAPGSEATLAGPAVDEGVTNLDLVTA